MIERIISEEDANICDNLLNELIMDEKQYDNTIDESFRVKDYYKNMIVNKDFYLLAYKEDNIIKGYLFLKKINNVFFIDALYVEKEYRRKGIASSLISEALKIAGDNKVDINVLLANTQAYNLYKKFGFVDYKVTMRKDN